MQIRLLEANNIEELETLVNKELQGLRNTNEIIDVRFKPVTRESFIYYYAEIIYK